MVRRTSSSTVRSKSPVSPSRIAPIRAPGRGTSQDRLIPTDGGIESANRFVHRIRGCCPYRSKEGNDCTRDSSDMVPVNKPGAEAGSHSTGTPASSIVRMARNLSSEALDLIHDRYHITLHAKQMLISNWEGTHERKPIDSRRSVRTLELFDRVDPTFFLSGDNQSFVHEANEFIHAVKQPPHLQQFHCVLQMRNIDLQFLLGKRRLLKDREAPIRLRSNTVNTSNTLLHRGGRPRDAIVMN